MSEKHAEPAAEAGAKPKSSMTGKIIVLAVIGAVIGGECLMAALYLPSVAASGTTQPAESAEHAPVDDGHAADAGQHDDHGHGAAKTPASNSQTQQREVDLGEFSLTAFQPASNNTLLIDFHLYATVNVDAHEEEAAPDSGGHGHGKPGDAKSNDEFSKLYDKCKHRIRDQVITIVRSSEMTDFADPSLGLIRRKILEKSNRALGKPLLTEVIFSDFSIVEQ